MITDKTGFIQINIPPGCYELESLNHETQSINMEEGHFTEENYPFLIKPSFSTMTSIIETSRQEPLISFTLMIAYEIFKNRLSEKYNLSPNPVDILSLDYPQK